MPTAARLLRVVLGALLGLLAVEGTLQGIRLAVGASDAQHTQHDLAANGGDLRVLCLGACYTIGIGTAPEDAYPAQLEARLDAQLATWGADAVVINGGQRGKSIDHFAANIDTLLTEHQPRIVIVGVNRRTRLDTEAVPRSGLFQQLLLPRLVALAVAPPPPPSPVTTDAIAIEIAALQAHLQTAPHDLDGWMNLSKLHAKRGDYPAARTALMQAAGPRPVPPQHMALFRYAIAMGDHTAADQHLEAVRSAPAFVGRMAQDIDARVDHYATSGRDVQLRVSLDQARLAVVRSDFDTAQELVDATLRRDPDTSDAWHLQAYIDHRLGRPARPRTDAFLGTHRAQLAPEATPDLVALEAALHRYVRRIQRAARDHDAVVLLHTLAATPEQIPVIQAVGASAGVPVIDVQTALAAVEDPEPLFHPTDHLRFSAAGNAWLADQIHQGLADANLVPAP